MDLIKNTQTKNTLFEWMLNKGHYYYEEVIEIDNKGNEKSKWELRKKDYIKDKDFDSFPSYEEFNIPKAYWPIFQAMEYGYKKKFSAPIKKVIDYFNEIGFRDPYNQKKIKWNEKNYLKFLERVFNSPTTLLEMGKNSAKSHTIAIFNIWLMLFINKVRPDSPPSIVAIIRKYNSHNKTSTFKMQLRVLKDATNINGFDCSNFNANPNTTPIRFEETITKNRIIFGSFEDYDGIAGNIDDEGIIIHIQYEELIVKKKPSEARRKITDEEVESNLDALEDTLGRSAHKVYGSGMEVRKTFTQNRWNTSNFINKRYGLNLFDKEIILEDTMQGNIGSNDSGDNCFSLFSTFLINKEHINPKRIEQAKIWIKTNDPRLYSIFWGENIEDMGNPLLGVLDQIKYYKKENLKNWIYEDPLNRFEFISSSVDYSKSVDNTIGGVAGFVKGAFYFLDLKQYKSKKHKQRVNENEIQTNMIFDWHLHWEKMFLPYSLTQKNVAWIDAHYIQESLYIKNIEHPTRWSFKNAIKNTTKIKDTTITGRMNTIIELIQQGKIFFPIELKSYVEQSIRDLDIEWKTKNFADKTTKLVIKEITGDSADFFDMWSYLIGGHTLWAKGYFRKRETYE